MDPLNELRMRLRSHRLIIINVINNCEVQYNTNSNTFFLVLICFFINLLINTREKNNCLESNPRPLAHNRSGTAKRDYSIYSYR